MFGLEIWYDTGLSDSLLCRECQARLGQRAGACGWANGLAWGGRAVGTPVHCSWWVNNVGVGEFYLIVSNPVEILSKSTDFICYL